MNLIRNLIAHIGYRMDAWAVNRTIQLVHRFSEVPAGILDDGSTVYLAFVNESDEAIDITFMED